MAVGTRRKSRRRLPPRRMPESVRSGREHAFRVTSGEASRHIVILTPGGFEAFFHEMARGQFRIPEDMPAVETSAARHHLTFTGPPLGVN